MVVILACLSAMLTLGGGAMALYGADLIRTDSGVALTGAGVTMTSAGLLLLGITCLFAEMRRMRRLMEAEEILPPVTVPAPPPLPVPGAATNNPVERVEPALAEPALVASPVEAAPAAGSPARQERPAKEEERSAKAAAAAPPIPPVVKDRGKPAGSGIPAEAMASLVGSAAMMKGGKTEPPMTAAGQDTPDTPADLGPDAVTPMETGTGAEEAASAAASSSVDSPAAPPESPRTMLATYNSGGVTYFMYSDSSIEADMAGGRYRFSSMDELRGFIETGKGGLLVTPAEAAPTPTVAEAV